MQILEKQKSNLATSWFFFEFFKQYSLFPNNFLYFAKKIKTNEKSYYRICYTFNFILLW